jgi:DNA repair exonuclease SbcCD ATPase subunit
MKQERIFLSFFFVISLGFILAYYTVKLKDAQDNSSRLFVNQQAQTQKLESQISQLQETLDSAKKSERMLDEVFQKEKERTASLEKKFFKANAVNKNLAKKINQLEEEKKKADELEQKLNQAISKNEALSREIAGFKTKIESSRPIQERLAQIINDLSAEGLSDSQEVELKIRFDSLAKELESINSNFSNFAQIFGEGIPVALAPRVTLPALAGPDRIQQLEMAKRESSLGKEEVSMSRQSYQKPAHQK